MSRDQRAIALRFAADDRHAQIGADESLERGRVRGAVVDPHPQCWKLCANAAQRGEIVARALNRVEIGNIERGKRKDREKAAHDVDGVTGWRERRFDWPVRRAITPMRAHDLAALEVNDRDRVQAQPPMRRRRNLRRLVLEPAPGFGLRGARGLADDDFEAREFGLDLGAGQKMQAAHQHGALDHCRLRAIEALERRMRGAMRNATHETGPELMLAHFDDNELKMRQSRRQTRRGDDGRRS